MANYGYIRLNKKLFEQDGHDTDYNKHYKKYNYN